VTYLQKQPAPVKSPGVGDHELEFLTKALNTAISRSRLTTNALESIAAALRHKQATPAEAREWLREENLDQFVGRYMPKGGAQ
jgi:hypothetical protein